VSARDVLWPARPPRSRAKLARALRRLLAGRVREAYIFGSYARGEAQADSDLDLILVVETDAAWPERGRAFLDLARVGPPVDLLVYTPAEWARMRSERHPVFARRREWIALIPANRTRSRRA
jgi:predicted nucleotidyltransferase